MGVVSPQSSGPAEPAAKASGRLKRSIGLRTVVSTSAGLAFASSTFLVVAQAGGYLAGDSAWIAIAIAGLLCALAAACFSELNGMWPSVNGIRLYIHRAFGEKVSLIASLTYMSVITLVVGTETYVLSHVLSSLFTAISAVWWIVVMLTLATVVNFCGLKVAGAVQDVVIYAVAASIITMSVWVLAKAHFHVPAPLHVGGAGALFNAVGVAIFLFVGFEWVTPLADEVKTPRAIPAGMFLALALLVGMYALIATAMFSGAGGVTSHALLWTTGGERQPTPHLVFALAALGPAGRICMAATSLLMSLTMFNAGLIGVSRFLYGMARDQVLPRGLAAISERFSTPYRAVLVVYAIAMAVSLIVAFTQKFVLLVNLAAATESFIYAFAAASVIALRIKDPSRDRPFRMAGGLWLPGLTGIVFLAIGIGVFAQPHVEFWGAAVTLAAVALVWWAYIHFHAHPRLVKMREEAAAKRVSRRPTRRPAADPSDG